MTDARRRRRGADRAAARKAVALDQQLPAIERKIPTYDLFNDESLELALKNAETLLQEVGLDLVNCHRAAKAFADAGQTVTLVESPSGSGAKDQTIHNVRFDKGWCRDQMRTLPGAFTQHARNRDRSVPIGGNRMVFAPVYGPPFVMDREGGRRYGTMADFEDLVKLTYLSPALHHSGGTVCEPVDVPVNKRHLDMVYAHLKYSDKPIMGSVTAPERAQDTVDMLKIVFGGDFVDNQACATSLINLNSPLALDDTMMGALEVYAENHQAVITSPFLISGAMAPVSAMGVMTQALAELFSSMAYTQLVRPGAPAIFGTFAASMSMQSGAPTFGTPEPSQIIYGMAQLARKLGLPFRSGGSLCASKLPDAQAAYETANSLNATLLAGTNFVLHAAGWLEGGLVSSKEKLIMDADQLAMLQKLGQGPDLSDDGQAMDAFREVGPRGHYLGAAHTQRHMKTAFYDSKLLDYRPYETWTEDGSPDTYALANRKMRRMLQDYEAPALDPAIDDALREFVAKRKASMPDASF